MKPQYLITIAVAALSLVAHSVYAAQVSGLTTFQSNTPAKAAEVNGNFSKVQSAVNDNDTRLTNVEVSVAGGNVKGALLTQFAGNAIFPSDTTGYTGYYGLAPVISNAVSTYTPPVDATAFVTTRCSFEGDAALQFLEHHVAISSGGTVTTGTQYAMGTHTPAAGLRVQDANFDYFDLTANTSYDFGVNFTTETPKNSGQNGYCSVVVMVFRK
jgi:hypothetical protein